MIKLQKLSSTTWRGNNMGTDAAIWVFKNAPHIHVYEISGGWIIVNSKTKKKLIRGAKSRKEALYLFEHIFPGHEAIA